MLAGFFAFAPRGAGAAPPGAAAAGSSGSASRLSRASSCAGEKSRGKAHSRSGTIASMRTGKQMPAMPANTVT